MSLWVHNLILLGERAIYIKWPPNARRAKRPENEADKSSVLVNEFNRELTYRNMVPTGSRTFN